MRALARTVRYDLVGSGGDSAAEQRSGAPHWQGNAHKASGHADEGDPRKIFCASHQTHARQRSPGQLHPEHATTHADQIDLAISSQRGLIVVRLAED
jgi:hypothetical protein